jgi:hypothetical protein
MRIEISELHAVTERLFDHLDELGCHAVELSKDFYWDVPAADRYDPHTLPPELVLGQLYDDWNEMEKIIKNQSEPIAYALVWLSALLRFVGEEVTG